MPMNYNFLENWPFDVLFEAFAQQGEEVYLVGGAVRDLLLGKRPGDWDFTSSAEPDKITAILAEAFPGHNLILKGKRFGTIGIDLSDADEDVSFEITAFRKEEGYTDGRHPEEVAFQASIFEDVRRRDFTVNGLWMDRHGVIFDAVGGLTDLKEKNIRCIGQAVNRFDEDRLRKWRCVRFAAQIGGQIEPHTREAIVQNPGTDGVSLERIQIELSKMLTGPNAVYAVQELIATGLWDDLLKRTVSTDLPVVSKDVADKINALPRVLPIRLAWLFQDAPADRVGGFLKRLHFSNQVIRQGTMLSGFDALNCTDMVGFKTALRQMGAPVFEMALELQKLKKDNAQNCAAFADIVKNREPILPADLAISGKDLKALGFRGRQIGETIERLMQWVYEAPAYNQRGALLKRAVTWLNQENNNEGEQS